MHVSLSWRAPVCVSGVGQRTRHTSACADPSGGCACCWLFSARALSLGRRPKWGVCVDRSAERECSRQLLFFSSSSGGGREGRRGLGPHDILAKKKKTTDSHSCLGFF